MREDMRGKLGFPAHRPFKLKSEADAVRATVPALALVVPDHRLHCVDHDADLLFFAHIAPIWIEAVTGDRLRCLPGVHDRRIRRCRYWPRKPALRRACP